MKESIKQPDNQNMGWIEIALLITKPELSDNERINKWVKTGANVTIIRRSNSINNNIGEIDSVHQKVYGTEVGKAAIWNEIIYETDAEWVFLLEDDEDFDLNDLLSLDRKKNENWIPAKIVQKSNEESSFKQYFQIRLIPGKRKGVFDGREIPDATNYITKNNIELSKKTISIYRNSELFTDIDIEGEMSVTNFSPQLYLYSAFRLLEEKKTAYAAANFRVLLKREKLIAYDRLAAVNGLASCLTEQFKWDKGLVVANESIDAQPQQFLPYLIKFRIFQLNKQWNEALDVLKSYHEILTGSGYSRANFEKFIKVEETVVQLADLAIRTGLRKEALHFYEELYSYKKDENDSDLLNILLVLSIELLDYERSVYYFKEIFEEYLPDKLCEDKARDLNDFLSMFMVNGWYDYPSEVYDMLYEQESGNGEYRRRLIVTLSKTNRLDRARKLIVQNM